ncbi:MAG: Gx transporter family protein [Oscillospiraceae bacterium]|nr:Gx transporter family protein [Oscillospiraceae bacterium]
MDKKRLAQMGLLTCIALIIFVVEMQIPLPVPVPGMKLGLANIVTVYAVYRYTPKEAALILTARIILGSIFSGNPSALLFSISGGILCLFGMIFLKCFIDEKHIYLSSIIGAVLHNMGQVTAAAAVTGTMSVFAYLPVLTVSGCIAGLFTGICAQIAVNRIGVK